MSVYQPFPTIAAAIEEFAAGQCRRHVEVGGHVIDLVQAMAEAHRPHVDPGMPPPSFAPPDVAAYRDTWDMMVASVTAAELSGALPPLAPPEVPAPPVECCRACGRPLIGGGS